MLKEAFQAGYTRKLISRREFIMLSWFSLLGILVIKLINLGKEISTPVRKNNTFGGVFSLGPVADLPAVGEDPLPVPEGKFWLVRTEAGLIALHRVCTHLDCLCNWNTVTESFACPCHGSEFGRDGVYLKGPAGRSLDKFVVRLVDADGAIVAETDEASGVPVPVPESSLAEDGSFIEPELTVEVDTGRKIQGVPIG